MGRMHSNGKGMSGSALPYKRTPPSWLKTNSGEVRLRPVHAVAVEEACVWSQPATSFAAVARIRRCNGATTRC